MTTAAFDPEKTALRDAMRQKRRGFLPSARIVESALVCQHILRFIDGKSKKTPCNIAYYVALNHEADLGILDDALRVRKMGRAVPRTDQARLLFHLLDDTPLKSLLRSDIGIAEPASFLPSVALADCDVVFVPGIAFDTSGGRLGAGQGFYDRAIAKCRRQNAETLFFGVALSYQIVDKIPMDAHDEPMDGLVTAVAIEKVMRR